MKNLMSATGLVVVLVLFLGFNLFTGAALTSARLDMTENKLYTLSQGTKNVLDALEEPITLKFYFSKGLAQQAPGIVSYAQRVEELLDMVELPRTYRNRYPHELSGGQRQRVGIARALALDPSILVADEPTSALDVSVQARVLTLLTEIQKRQKFAILFISHDLAVIDLLSDRIAVMHNGKIVEQGSTDQILRNPKDPYTKRLIAAVPVPDPEEQRERRRARTTT